MARIELPDPDDPRITPFRSLRDGVLRDQGALPPTAGQPLGPSLFLAESEELILRCLRTGHTLERVLADPNCASRLAPEVPQDVDLLVAPAQVIAGISGLGVHRGALALVRRPPPSSVADVLASAPRSVAVLESVGNPVNVGLIVRSAAAFGVGALLLDATSADPLYRRALTASRGATLSLPWARSASAIELVGGLHHAGYATVALTLADDAVALDRALDDLGSAGASGGGIGIALLLGNEGGGLSAEVQAACRVRATIELETGPAVDSLNVAGAAAVAFYELHLRRR